MLPLITEGVETNYSLMFTSEVAEGMKMIYSAAQKGTRHLPRGKILWQSF